MLGPPSLQLLQVVMLPSRGSDCTASDLQALDGLVDHKTPFKDDLGEILKIHKHTNTQIHKYTNMQILMSDCTASDLQVV